LLVFLRKNVKQAMKHSLFSKVRHICSDSFFILSKLWISNSRFTNSCIQHYTVVWLQQ